MGCGGGPRCLRERSVQSSEDIGECTRYAAATATAARYPQALSYQSASSIDPRAPPLPRNHCARHAAAEALPPPRRRARPASCVRGRGCSDAARPLQLCVQRR